MEQQQQQMDAYRESDDDDTQQIKSFMKESPFKIMKDELFYEGVKYRLTESSLKMFSQIYEHLKMMKDLPDLYAEIPANLFEIIKLYNSN